MVELVRLLLDVLPSLSSGHRCWLSAISPGCVHRYAGTGHPEKLCGNEVGLELKHTLACVTASPQWVNGVGQLPLKDLG